MDVYLPLRNPGCTKGDNQTELSNQGVIVLSKDNKLHQHTKHIDIRYHFIHEAVEDGQIRTNYVPTDQNPADIFTKPLSKTKFRGFVAGLGLRAWREEEKQDVSS